MAVAKKRPTHAKIKRKADAKPVVARKKAAEVPLGYAVLELEDGAAWLTWLEKNHATVPGVFVKIAKRESTRASVTAREAVECALRYGWIDGQGRSLDERDWLFKLTPRRPRSLWSKINRERALALIASGEMRPAGLAEVERARADGRWDAAYDSPRTMNVPEDLAAALKKNARARKFFETLNSANRYAILWRLQTAKKAETRARRLNQYVAMLANQEKFHS